MPKTEKELKKFIENYIKENLSISVVDDYCCDDKRITVELYLKNKQISSSDFYL